MRNLMLHLALIATLVGFTTTVGAVPFLVMREVPRNTYDAMLGLGAGLMLAAATLGLLPAALVDVRAGGAVQLHVLATVLGGFATGAALLFAMDRFIPH